MKKTLVAIAALVATTGAMADATITGLMQIGTSSTSTTASSVTTSTTALNDANGNSMINVKDVEDLGDGITATMQLSIAANLNGANSTGQETYFALSGGFGELKAGKFGNDQFWTVVAGDATGFMGTNAAVVNLGFGSTAAFTTEDSAGTLTTAAVVGSMEVWTANQVRYQLPTFVPGLTLAYTTKLGSQTTNIFGAETVTAGYTTGALNFKAASTQYKASTTATDILNSYAVSYDFGPAKLYALSTSDKISGASTVTGKNIGVSVPMGAFTLMYNNSTATAYVSNRAVTAVSQSNSEAAVTYAFSKRTTGWVYYTKYDGATAFQNTGGTALAGNGFTSTRFMILHAF